MAKGGDEKIIFRLAGDRGLMVELGHRIDPQIHAKVRALSFAIKENLPQGVMEIIPAYRSLLLIYDPVLTRPGKLIPLIEHLEKTLGERGAGPGKLVEIPVCYGGELGPDIDTVGKMAGLDQEGVIQLHCRPEYFIYMVGFTPGFPFLGGLDEKLFTPRLKTPRKRVPPGSVGIANNQTGIYPIASPGGWQIIGRTPLTLFAPQRENPFLFEAGDRIKFLPISPDDYLRLKSQEDVPWKPSGY